MISPIVASLNKSSTLKITALTKQLKSEGKDVVNFAAGEPDFDTPEFIKDAAKKAIDAGFTKYTPSTGLPELKEAIAKKLREENNYPAKAENIIVTAGAKYAIFAAIFTVVKKGDGVIIPSPFWVSYPEIVKMAGGKIQILKTYARSNFKIDPVSLEKAIKKNTKLLILNYPANPTGMTYTHDELKAIYDVAARKGILVLSDEIYEKLMYDGQKHVAFASLPSAHTITLTVNGFSKAFSMTGWRLGYLAADAPIINETSKLIDHTTSCACSIAQKAAIAALAQPQWQEQMRQIFEERRNILYAGLKSCKKIKPIKSQGTFYMFCDIRRSGLNSLDFASQLLSKQLVSLIPTHDFAAEGYVRISFATSNDDIAKGIERIKKFEAEL